MTALSTGSISAIGERFPWSGYRTFADIGCAEGGLGVHLARRHPPQRRRPGPARAGAGLRRARQCRGAVGPAKVFGAGWHYDAAASGRKRTAWGNNWVVVVVLVRLPFVAHRMLCLPVLARLWQPRRPGRSKLDLACQFVGLICQRHPDRRVHLVCDAAYAGKALRGLACCA